MPKRCWRISTRSGSATAARGASQPSGRIGPLSVEAGRTPDGALWLPAYRLVRKPDDANASYLEAHATCRKSSLVLLFDLLLNF